jgi:hypothetical protein
MDSATRQMIEAVDKRMAKLKQIRALITEEFGDLSNGVSAKPRVKRHNGQLSGRKKQLHDWLKKNGPATRAEIIKGSGLPDGTVGGYLSTEKDLFESRDEKWHAR